MPPHLPAMPSCTRCERAERKAEKRKAEASQLRMVLKGMKRRCSCGGFTPYAEGDAAECETHIQLKVKDQQGIEVMFKIKKTTPLRKLMSAYCSRLGLQLSQVRFMVDGERIDPDDTAEKLSLEDWDVVQAFWPIRLIEDMDSDE